ncbi:hypothetical protein HDU92_003416 [Lobulomyces angularis]|nr:hypothetical protein HDU92_003416 [Lobulomyces angularis]
MKIKTFHTDCLNEDSFRNDIQWKRNKWNQKKRKVTLKDNIQWHKQLHNKRKSQHEVSLSSLRNNISQNISKSDLNNNILNLVQGRKHIKNQQRGSQSEVQQFYNVSLSSSGHNTNKNNHAFMKKDIVSSGDSLTSHALRFQTVNKNDTVDSAKENRSKKRKFSPIIFNNVGQPKEDFSTRKYDNLFKLKNGKSLSSKLHNEPTSSITEIKKPNIALEKDIQFLENVDKSENFEIVDKIDKVTSEDKIRNKKIRYEQNNSCVDIKNLNATNTEISETNDKVSAKIIKFSKLQKNHQKYSSLANIEKKKFKKFFENQVRSAVKFNDKKKVFKNIMMQIKSNHNHTQRKENNVEKFDQNSSILDNKDNSSKSIELKKNEGEEKVNEVFCKQINNLDITDSNNRDIERSKTVNAPGDDVNGENLNDNLRTSEPVQSEIEFFNTLGINLKKDKSFFENFLKINFQEKFLIDSVKKDGMVIKKEEVKQFIFNHPITKNELKQVLKMNTWLNDEIINSFLLLLEQYFNFMHNNDYCEFSNNSLVNIPQRRRCKVFSTFFWTTLSKTHESAEKFTYNYGYLLEGVQRWTKRDPSGLGVFGSDLIFIPINWPGRHWSIVVINVREKTIMFNDSFGMKGRKVVKLLKKYIFSEIKDKIIERNVYEEYKKLDKEEKFKKHLETFKDFEGWSCVKPKVQFIQRDGSSCGKIN